MSIAAVNPYRPPVALTALLDETPLAQRRTLARALEKLGAEPDAAALAAWRVRVDAALNAQAVHGRHAQAIHARDSAVEVWVVPTDEGRVAAAEAAALVPG